MAQKQKPILDPDSIGPVLKEGQCTFRLATKNNERWVVALDAIHLLGYEDVSKTIERYCDMRDVLKMNMYNSRGERRGLLMLNRRAVISIPRNAFIEGRQKQGYLMEKLLRALARPIRTKRGLGLHLSNCLGWIFKGSNRIQAEIGR